MAVREAQVSKLAYLIASTALTLALLAPASAPSALAQSGITFIGPVGETGAVIIVFTDGVDFTASVCAGPQLADLFQGPLAPVSEATSEIGSIFAMRFEGGQPTGTIVTPDGVEHQFATQAVIQDPNVLTAEGTPPPPPAVTCAPPS